MLEVKFIPEFPCEIIATDEVGRGPLSGPVVVSAVRVRVENVEELKSVLRFLRPKGIKDSKVLTSERRKKIIQKMGASETNFRVRGEILVKGITISYVLWEMDHEVIDAENILAASLRGMREAAEFLSVEENITKVIFIDGNQKLRWGNEISKWIEVPLVKGDSRSLLIGLASILAKEKRDEFMKEMHELYPQYGFNTHFGYPTSSHRKAIEEFGPSPIHRKTFKGVREFLGVNP